MSQPYDKAQRDLENLYEGYTGGNTWVSKDGIRFTQIEDVVYIELAWVERELAKLQKIIKGE